MKIDEPFNPEIKSKKIPTNIEFKLANDTHIDEIAALMHERNPNDSVKIIKAKTLNEIKLNKDDPTYWLYVAIINNKVVGLCRFYHSDGLPINKKKFSAPEGWYGMGILISSKWRRNSIAKYLTIERVKLLKNLKAHCLYSIVDSNNKTSVKMHENFGFKKIDQAHGFLHLDFKDQIAFLFELKI
ncbi:MAG: GNAT family N-acetyltransferase [Bacteriovorax sp.]|jgi:RimJ/RimL family protein N-acetyltransferase